MEVSDDPGGVPAPLRLNRYLAMNGVAARRKADELIASGRVTVNGKVPPPGGLMVDPAVDVVAVDGSKVATSLPRRRYYAVNKPPGYLSAVSDHTRRPLVTSLLPPGHRTGLSPVGRLDLQSRGLILLTDDGELSFRLQHPRHHVEKEYEAQLDRAPSVADLALLEAGVRLDEGVTAPARYQLLDPGAAGTFYVRVILRQGWKRQVRRSFAAVGRRVLDLRRVRVGPLALGALPEGEYRLLTDDEVASLHQVTGLKP
ncbi:MAG: pseudouridine synthase [Candidatus Dormibacteria bacterium]